MDAEEAGPAPDGHGGDPCQAHEEQARLDGLDAEHVLIIDRWRYRVQHGHHERVDSALVTRCR